MSPGNLAAPAIVTPPSGLVWDLTSAEGGQKNVWPASNQQFDGLVVRLDGEPCDWAATLSGTQERYSGIRYYHAFTNILPQNIWDGQNDNLTLAYPHWQPAFREVFRVTRKGASGQAARTLVFECMHNTAAIPVGDTCWLYLNLDWNGGVDPARSVSIQGFNLPLFAKVKCSGSTPSPDDPIYSRSFVEITFDQELPAIDWTPPYYTMETWLPQVPRLWLVHHSFYADAATKTLRKPYDWHWSVLRHDILANNGHLVLGGYQGIPTWRCYTHLFNWMGSLAEELFAMEKQALADQFGDTDPRMVADEMENEPVVQWLDAPGTDKPLGFRRSLLEIMYPTARAAWGAERTLILKATSFGSINSLRDEWDLDNDVHFGGGNNIIATHQYDDQAKWPGTDRTLWWDSKEDTDAYAGWLADAVSKWKFKAGGMTELGVGNWHESGLRGRMLGRMETSIHARGLFRCLWDKTGDYYSAAWLYRDVAGKEGKVTQALLPELRSYAGKAGRTV